MYDIAIVGGLGPAATAELFKRIVKYTDAKKDQDHIKILILNDPTIPDRTNYILNDGPCPLEPIMDNVAIASSVGCKYFALPCNTAHYFFETFEKVEGIEFINMVSNTCDYAFHRYPEKKVCVLATLGTVAGDVYKKNAKNKEALIYPSKDLNVKVMNAIQTIKAGEPDLEGLAKNLLENLKAEYDLNETVFLLSCTELSLLLPYLQGHFIDAMDVVAGEIVKKCGKRINKETYPLLEDCLN